MAIKTDDRRHLTAHNLRSSGLRRLGIKSREKDDVIRALKRKVCQLEDEIWTVRDENERLKTQLEYFDEREEIGRP
jgi:predicted RNase H-like nuclease (RuvC/YqgF family)